MTKISALTNTALHSAVKTHLKKLVNEAIERMNVASTDVDVYLKVRIIKTETNNLISTYTEGVITTLNYTLGIDTDTIENYATDCVNVIDAYADFVRM